MYEHGISPHLLNFITFFIKCDSFFLIQILYLYVRFISKYFNFIEFLRYIDFVSFIKFRTSLAIIFANIHPVSFSLPSWDSYYVYISTLDLILLVSDSVNFSSFFHSTPQTWSFQVAYLYAHKFFPLPAKICYLNLQVNSEFSFHYCTFISPEFLFIISMSLLRVSIYWAVILLV